MATLRIDPKLKEKLRAFVFKNRTVSYDYRSMKSVGDLAITKFFDEHKKSVHNP